MIPSLIPIFSLQEKKLIDGSEVTLTKFCKDAISNKAQCIDHYIKLSTKPVGYYQCPFGFTSRSFEFDGKRYVNTGVIAFPRFDTADERRVAKEFPANKVTRQSIEAGITYLLELEKIKANAIEDASKVLPQAFHELRKLNGAVIQHAEKEINARGSSASLVSIKSAAELMRNNFDILEALSNIDGIKSLPNDSQINLFDLAYMMKRVYEERINKKGMLLFLNGPNRPLILGSQKSFPIVPAVLIDNAIKYGKSNSHIHVNIEGNNGMARLVVENESDEEIDPIKCFERGVRYSKDNEGGGFGLFLAKEVVECHKGKIHCQLINNKIQMIVELPMVKAIPHAS